MGMDKKPPSARWESEQCTSITLELKRCLLRAKKDGRCPVHMQSQGRTGKAAEAVKPVTYPFGRSSVAMREYRENWEQLKELRQV